ncbi:alpha/beta hydrolase [Sphingomonas sp. ASV193]|uniref:alpha/beta hydrolase n=1 Tax=Sphingomonas sp. ASV193 TaxID=3144405 RepID=UPI0032E9119E
MNRVGIAGIWAGLAASIAVTGAAVAQRQRLPAECRQQLVERCRGAGLGGVRQCLATALPTLSDDCRKAIGAREGTPAAGMRTLSYGRDPKQALDLAVPAGGHAPVLLFVHGGGWSIGDKAANEAGRVAHFGKAGWAYASVNYRLVPQASVEQQAADVASAVAYLRANAARLGIDANRIVLMGHSAGAHLVALVGTDERYFRAVGVPVSAIRGAVLLDGAGYDIAGQMARPDNPVAAMYDAAFGRDPKRQAALSPTRWTAAPNVGAWLILPIARRADSLAQSQALAAGLSKAGARARVESIPDKSHGGLNKAIGEEGDYATGLVDAFLAGVN